VSGEGIEFAPQGTACVWDVEQIARVGVLGNQTQRSAFAAAADQQW
jgi:hypothetical protein